MTAIRDGTPADRAALVAMGEHFILAHPRLVGGGLPDPVRLGACIDLALGQELVLVAISDTHQVIGMALAVAIEHPFTGALIGDELALWVEPDYRGGTTWVRLLDALEQKVYQFGAVGLKMTAPAATTIGTVYERRGYVEVDHTFFKSFDDHPVSAR